MNGQPGTVYPDSSFDVADVPVAPGTNTLTATYTGPAFTNVPMTATDTSTVVLGDTAYTHDANGNLTGDATFLYQYDLANQLTNVVRKADNTRVLSCRYDALGRRVEAIRADGTTDRYVYFPGSFLVLAVLDENNAPKELYTRGPDLAGSLDGAGGIGGILACTYSNAPSSPLFHHADLMGNVIALFSSSGSAISTFRYTPYGQLTFPVDTIAPRYLFCSKELDGETQLTYFGYRYFSSNQGMWLTKDPASISGGINLYQYDHANPLLHFDAWGLAWWNCKNNCPFEGAIKPGLYEIHYRSAQNDYGPALFKSGKQLLGRVLDLGSVSAVAGSGVPIISPTSLSTLTLTLSDNLSSESLYPGFSADKVERALLNIDKRRQQRDGIVIWIYLEWQQCECKPCLWGRQYLDWGDKIAKDYKCPLGGKFDRELDGFRPDELELLQNSIPECIKMAMQELMK